MALMIRSYHPQASKLLMIAGRYDTLNILKDVSCNKRQVIDLESGVSIFLSVSDEFQIFRVWHNVLFQILSQDIILFIIIKDLYHLLL